MATTGEQRRGVGWVLQQAAIAAVLGLGAAHICGVVALTLCQRQLAAAAKEAAAEARLPKASRQRIEGQASRILDHRHRGATIAVSVYRKRGVQAPGDRLQPGDRVVVKVAAPARPMLPDFLAQLAPWLASEEVVAEAGTIVP